MKKPPQKTTEIVPLPLSATLNRLLFPQQPTIMENQTSSTKPTSRIVHRIRCVNVTACIRRQNTDKGPTFTVTFQRSDKEGKQLKTSASFGRREVFAISCVAARAFQWISARPHAPDV
jgi:hypothetical protein